MAILAEMIGTQKAIRQLSGSPVGPGGGYMSASSRMRPKSRRRRKGKKPPKGQRNNSAHFRPLGASACARWRYSMPDAKAFELATRWGHSHPKARKRT